MRPLFLASRGWLLPASPRGLSCARVCVPGVSSSHEDTGPLGLEFVTLMTPFNLITSLKAPPPDYVASGGEGFHLWIWGDPIRPIMHLLPLLPTFADLRFLLLFPPAPPKQPLRDGVAGAARGVAGGAESRILGFGAEAGSRHAAPAPGHRSPVLWVTLGFRKRKHTVLLIHVLIPVHSPSRPGSHHSSETFRIETAKSRRPHSPSHAPAFLLASHTRGAGSAPLRSLCSPSRGARHPARL